MLIGGFMRKIRELEEKIGYCFQDQELLKHALRHSSYVNEKHMKKHECNERLEFLGDAGKYGLRACSCVLRQRY